MVVPSGKALPLAGPEVRTMVAPEQLSETVGAVQVATPVQLPAPVYTVMSLGQPAIPGASMSFTVITNEQDTEFPSASVAVYAIVVLPTAKLLPLAGPALCTIVAPGQLSLTVGAVQVAVCAHVPAAAFNVWLTGQPTITGGSFISTVSTEGWEVAS